VRDAILWLIGIELVGLATLPLALRILFGLPDRGYAAAKILGLVLVGYVAWITSLLGLSAFTGPTIVVVTAVVGVVSWWCWGAQLRAAWATARPLALAGEAVFLVAFAIAAWIRAYNAPIAGQEKQMDFTFIHSLIQAQSLPAEDFWLAGFGMPYYYFGYLMQSLVAKVMPIDPAVAYNLAVASVLALGALGAFGLVASLTRLAGWGSRGAIFAGIFGAFALMVMGNLEALCEVFANNGIGSAALWSTVGAKDLAANTRGFPPTNEAGWWFRAARVIPNIQPDGITEFPYFSFLLGDLHPHFIAIPLALLVATLASHEVAIVAPLSQDRIRLGVSAIVLGAVIPSNTWDVPVLWGIFALALLTAIIRRGAFDNLPSRTRLVDIGLAFALAVSLYAPYFVGYVSQPLGLGFTSERTYFGTLVVLFGPLVVLAFAGGAVGVTRSAVARARLPEGKVLTGLAVAGLLFGVVLAGLGEPTLGYLVASLVLWGVLGWQRARLAASPASVATALLALVGLGSILVPELVFLRDVFASRMNTVFKFYYDAWIFLAAAAPLITGELIAAMGVRHVDGVEAEGQAERSTTAIPVRAGAAAGLALAAAFVLGGTIYPLAATTTKSAGFAGAPNLDGMAHLRGGRPDDAAVIDWLRTSPRQAPIVEAVGNDYTDAGRFSTFGGVPTLVGWVGHEAQWRGPHPEIERRKELVRRVYTDPDDSAWRKQLGDLGVRYIVVGTLERELYGPDAGASLAQKLRLAQERGATRVYSLESRPAVASLP
jgi:YYY domain-containing protein